MAPGHSSLQFYVFRLRLIEDGDDGIGVVPEGKEVLVGGTGLDKGIGLSGCLL